MSIQALSVTFSAVSSVAVTWASQPSPGLLTGVVLTAGTAPTGAPWFTSVTSTGATLSFASNFSGAVTVVVTQEP